MAEYHIISTGSHGNAIILNDEILIDCGVPYKQIVPYAKKLKLALLTHIHGDHFRPSTVRCLANDRPALRFAGCEWMANPLFKAGVPAQQIDVLQPGESYDYGVFRLSPVGLSHDVPNCGWRVFWGNEKIFYATDTGHLHGVEAKNYDLYMIEANYENEEIVERMKKKIQTNAYAYEYAVLKNHLSVEQANEFIYSNCGPTSEYVYLHQHIRQEGKQDDPVTGKRQTV